MTDYGSEAAQTPHEKYLQAKLVSLGYPFSLGYPVGLGYPWPENLEANSIAWPETEMKAITPAA